MTATKITTGEKTDGAITASLPSGILGVLDTPQASLYVGLAVSTLEKKRVTGDGPQFIRYGRKAVRYQIADLDAWMSAFRVASTSEV